MSTRTHEDRKVGMGSISSAFLRMDAIEDVSYPLSLILGELGVMAPVFIYFFIGELVPSSPEIGDDYFTFAVIGLCVSTILQAALGGFGGSLQRAQNRGTFETLLVEPVPWTFLPFAMNLWRVILGFLGGVLIFSLGLLLGADYVISGIPAFILLLILGVLASMGIGILAASLMVLAKRSQPVLTLYGLAASLLAGALFSVDQLPSYLRALSWAIPHTYVINSARTVLMDDPGSFSISFASAALALTIFNVVVFTGGLWLFNRSLQYARKMGMLSGY
ncbi:MAG TPA: ABC transporter permease [Acidimicrobiia bacterium]